MRGTTYFAILFLLGQFFLMGCQDKTVTTGTSTVQTRDSVKSQSVEPDTNGEDTYELDNDNGGEACFEDSGLNLPYNKVLDASKVNYNIVPCEIEGTEEFLCDNRGLRYLPLPKFHDVEVILVPMDCGDFTYRYFLLTVLHKKVVSNVYAEGEWFEPGNESYKEVTNFSIDEKYTISIATQSLENGKKALKSISKFQLLPDGRLEKIL